MDTLPEIFTQLQKALRRPLPGTAAQERMAGRVIPAPNAIPPDARESAVLIVLQPAAAAAADVEVLLIERTEDRSAHSRQIAFPGGRRDPEDDTLERAALREAWEEIGLEAGKVQILGSLTPLYIPVSRFVVHPFVAMLTEEAVSLSANPLEVARILPVSLRQLFHPSSRIIAEVSPASAKGATLRVPAYRLPADGTLVWGATAMILSELETLLPFYGRPL